MHAYKPPTNFPALVNLRATHANLYSALFFLSYSYIAEYSDYLCLRARHVALLRKCSTLTVQRRLCRMHVESTPFVLRASDLARIVLLSHFSFISVMDYEITWASRAASRLNRIADIIANKLCICRPHIARFFENEKKKVWLHRKEGRCQRLRLINQGVIKHLEALPLRVHTCVTLS